MERPRIPGERSVESPGVERRRVLSELRPFVRQSGDAIRPRWFLPARELLDYLLVLIPDGRGEFTVGDESFTLEDGGLAWIPPAVVHEMRGVTERMRCLYVHFDLLYDPERSHWDACVPGGTLDLTSWSLIAHPPLDVTVVRDWSGLLRGFDYPAVLELTRRICLEHKRSPAGAAVKLSGMMLELIDELLRSDESVGAEETTSWRRRLEVEWYIRERLKTNLKVGEMARRFGMSQSHFRKVFRESFGESPRSAHRRARIREACELLVYSDLNVTEIAERLGFSSIHSFTRAFRDVVGLPPGVYRRGG